MDKEQKKLWSEPKIIEVEIKTTENGSSMGEDGWAFPCTAVS